LILSAVFGVIEWRWPSVRNQRRLRAGFLTDLAYWLFTPTVGKLFTGVVVFVSVIAVARLLGVALDPDDLKAGVANQDSAISQQPVGVQILEFFLLADFLAYWQHRAFHHFERLWRMHAVHHSSTELDWLSSVRVHPLNDAIASTAVAAPLLLFGFAPAVLAAYLPFLTLYAIFLHANVRWTFGPLRYLIATPAFHRWHHSLEQEALDKNYGGLMPVWDMLFGTFYLPRGRQASRFGVVTGDVPYGFISQLIYPLRGANRTRRTVTAS
jgi:sterol desaturase/sphingolipid hydroxylase (fatty acid hydroxylase superfamily)